MSGNRSRPRRNPISSSSERGDIPIALLLLFTGALLVVAGVATLSVGAALICGGLLLMAGGAAYAAALDHAAKPPVPRERVE